MKSIILSCLLLCYALTAFCSPDINRVERKINKSFQISKEAQLQVSNKYGNITIVTWNKNEINFDIQIVGKADRADDAQKLADRADIKFSQTGNMVSAETIFSEIKNIRGNQSTEVNYTISLPESVSMDLNNKYGNIQLENTSQKFTCNVKYGNLWANLLTGKSSIDCKYGNIKAVQITTGNITLGYGNLSVDKADDLIVSTSYSKVKIGSINKLDATSKYDNYDMGTVGSMKLTSGSYGNFYLAKLTGSFVAPDIRYGKIRIPEIASDFDNIEINAGYTNIKLGISKQASCKADFSTRYGDIDISKQLDTSKLKFSDKEESRYTRTATGIIGSSSNPKSTLKVYNTYNDINIGE